MRSQHESVLDGYRCLCKGVRAVTDPITIAIIGDVMLDVHVTCDVLGMSPEDDLAWKLKPVLTRYSPGGAANVAMNVNSIGAKTVLFGRDGIGRDSEILREILPRNDLFKTHWVNDTGFSKTTVKTRYITKHGRHTVRIDDEEYYELTPRDAEYIGSVLSDLKPNLIVISDYAKGMITPYLMEVIEALKIQYIVDPKQPFNIYQHPLVITPNEKEARKALTGCDNNPASLEDLMKLMDAQTQDDAGWGPDYLLVTLGSAGAKLWENVFTLGGSEYAPTNHFKAHTRDHGDPTGCGDALIAALAYALAWQWGMEDAVRLAIAAGSCAFGHTGVYVVKPDDIIAELAKGDPNGPVAS